MANFNDRETLVRQVEGDVATLSHEVVREFAQWARVAFKRNSLCVQLQIEDDVVRVKVEVDVPISPCAP